MGWLRRICPQHMSAVCAALHSAKDCHCAGCAVGRIAVATCSLTRILTRLCARSTADIPTPSRLKKPRDTLPNKPIPSLRSHLKEHMKVASWSACEPGLLHVNLDVGSHHTDSVADDIVVGRRTKDLSGPNIELGAMQWAGHFVSRDLSLGQRSLLVRAHVVDGEELAVDVEQSNLFALYINQSSLPGIDLVSPCNLHKVGHPCSPSLPAMASTYLSVILWLAHHAVDDLCLSELKHLCCGLLQPVRHVQFAIHRRRDG